MSLIQLSALIIALLHIAFGVIELFYWKEKGPGLLKHVVDPKDAGFFEKSQVMASNQAYYNWVLAAGLLASAFYFTGPVQKDITLLFLSFVVVVGLYGYYSTHSKTLLIAQLLFGAAAWIVVFFFLSTAAGGSHYACLKNE